MTASSCSRRVLAFVICLLLTPLSAAALQPAPEPALEGRLATVESGTRRITLVPDGEVNVVELFAADDCEMLQGERVLTIRDLVTHVGRRVSVRYTTDGGRRVATHITVAVE